MGNQPTSAYLGHVVSSPSLIGAWSEPGTDDRYNVHSPVCRSLTDCSVCSDGYNSELGFICSECADSVDAIVLAAVLAVVALVVTAGTISYVMSGETEVSGSGVVERLRRYIPLQSLKIIVVAWQILTQVNFIVDFDDHFGASR